MNKYKSFIICIHIMYICKKNKKKYNIQMLQF